MQFEEEPTQSGSTQEDEMIGFLRGVNVVDITEIFSPPRIAQQCKAFGLRAGSSMDLMTGWNFDLEVDRESKKTGDGREARAAGGLTSLHICFYAAGAEQAQDEERRELDGKIQRESRLGNPPHHILCRTLRVADEGWPLLVAQRGPGLFGRVRWLWGWGSDGVCALLPSTVDGHLKL